MGAWKYHIVHDYNATRLLKEFREENLKLKNSKGSGDDEIDFIIYAEKDDMTISLGRVLLIKMSDAMIKYFYQYKGKEDLTKVWSEHIYKEQKLKDNKTFQFTVDDLSKAFLVSIGTQSKLLFDISVLDAENYLKRLTDNLSDFLHDDLKFSREQWDPTLGSDNYLFAKPEAAVNYFVKKCDNLTKELKNIKERLELFKSFRFFEYELKTPMVNNLIATIDKLIKNVQKFKTWVIANKNDILYKIPYICGVWNGMVEFLAGIIDIILLAIKILIDELFADKLNLELLELRESIEEILSAIIKDPEKIFNEAIEAINNYKYSRYVDPKLNKYQLQYNEGEDTILAIDLIVTIVTVIKGLAALSRKLPKFTKWIDDVLKRRRTKKIAESFKRLENAWLKGWSKEKVLEKPKYERPNPKEYLKADYIKEHSDLFQKEGIASRIVPKDKFEEFGVGKPDIEKTEFVSRKSDIDDILMLSIEEQSAKLGIPIKKIENGDVVRIDFKLSKEVKIEMPSGNEWGTNQNWIPGGVLPEGNLEAIIRTEGLKENVHFTIKYLGK